VSNKCRRSFCFPFMNHHSNFASFKHYLMSWISSIVQITKVKISLNVSKSLIPEIFPLLLPNFLDKLKNSQVQLNYLKLNWFNIYSKASMRFLGQSNTLPNPNVQHTVISSYLFINKTRWPSHHSALKKMK